MLNIRISAHLQMKVQMAMHVSSKFQLHIPDIENVALLSLKSILNFIKICMNLYNCDDSIRSSRGYISKPV